MQFRTKAYLLDEMTICYNYNNNKNNVLSITNTKLLGIIIERVF